jgi:hypothetical protein
MPSHKEVSSAKAEPTPLIRRPSPESEDLEEGFEPSDLPYFEDDFFEDFGNEIHLSKETIGSCHSF